LAILRAVIYAHKTRRMWLKNWNWLSGGGKGRMAEKRLGIWRWEPSAEVLFLFMKIFSVERRGED